MKTKRLLPAMAAVGGLLISANLAFAQTWTLMQAPSTNWSVVACSADGSRLVASAFGLDEFGGSAPGSVFNSTNAGASWTSIPPRNASNGSSVYMNWSHLALSADGAKIFAAGWPPGCLKYTVPMYASTNGGGTWTSTDSLVGNWVSLAASGDGTRLAAVLGLGYWPYHALISTNSGVNWTAIIPAETDVYHGVSRCAWSADGSTLAFCGATLAVSTNGGATWTEFYLSRTAWSSVASSADGTRLVAATFDSQDSTGTSFPGVIYASRNSGRTWTLTSAPRNYWRAVASSADGSRLVAVASYAPYPPCIYSSIDGGANWVSNSAPVLDWVSVASSADGCRLVATERGGGIYSCQTVPKPVLNTTRSGRDLLLSWTVPSMPFVLQECADLTAPDWMDVPAERVLDSARLQEQIIIHAPEGARFYRLKGAN